MISLQFDCRNSLTNPENGQKCEKNGQKCQNKGSKTSIYPKKYLGIFRIFRIILLDICCRNSPQKRAKKEPKKRKNRQKSEIKVKKPQ